MQLDIYDFNILHRVGRHRVTYLTACCYHVRYEFHIESTLCSCMNVKERLAQNRCNIWNLTDSNRVQTHNHLHNHLVCKQKVIHLATLKCVCDMIIAYGQMHRTDKYSQHSSVTLSVWLNDLVFVYKLGDCSIKSLCCQLYCNLIILLLKNLS